MNTTDLLHFLERANRIAAITDLDPLLDETLGLLVDACGASAGLLYLPEGSATGVASRLLVTGSEAISVLLSNRPLAESLALPEAALLQREMIRVDDLPAGAAQYPGLAELAECGVTNTLAIPLLLADSPACVVQVFDIGEIELEMAQLLGNRLASDVEKALLLEASRLRSRRLETLIAIIGQIGSTLDRDQLLRLIINSAREFLGAEAASLFLLDETQGDLVLLLASNINENVAVERLRVPAGKGIIGHAVQSGKTVLVPDVAQDARHYSGVDHSSGFITRSILAVPLRARTVDLGGGRGATRERIIGGVEAINKIEGTFNDDDAHLLCILTNQAATVLEIASLYNDANELFMDVVKSLTAAIDAKDPYTEGHSERVSEFSAAIACELGLPGEAIHHIRIGGLLHDVGKIGVPDAILCKPGKLTDAEYDLMKQHPTIGAKIMGQVRTLHTELPAMAEHQERLDGTGYPRGLKDGEISTTSRIVAVADVFDAMTSDRPYRKAMSADETFDYLHERGDLFDRACVNALLRAYRKGAIRTQKERVAPGEDSS